PSRKLGGVCFDLPGLNWISRDRDPARLHLLGDVALELDVQQAVPELGAKHLDMVGKLEAALERPRGDAAMQESRACVLLPSLAALDARHVAMGFYGDVVLREAGYGHRDAVGILAGALDIVGRIGLTVRGLSERVEHREKTVETDGRTIERRKINVTHGCVLL